jgi:hypothetical protein
MFGQKKSGFTLSDITKTASAFGITPNFLKKTATSVGTQFATSAKAGLNARVARAASGLQTRIAGAPPTPTPVGTQNPTPIKPAGFF